MNKLFKIPYYFLVVGVVLLGVLLLATLLPIPGNLKVKIVKSGSMEPAIKTGGIVFIRSASSYSVNDVVTFGKDTKTQIPTTHRIIGVEGSGNNKVFTTKGDANDAADPEVVRADTVIGKVLFTIPYAGFVLDFAKKPIGFAILVGLPALIIIFEEILSIWKEIKRIRRKRGSEEEIYVANTIYPEKQKEDRNSVYREGNILDLRAKFESKQNIAESGKQSNNFGFKAIIIFFTALLPILGLGRVGNTISFYNESEVSMGNMLQASSDFGLNFAAKTLSSISDFVPSLSEVPGEVFGTEDSTEEEVEETEEEKVEEQSDSLVNLDEEKITEDDKTEEEKLPNPTTLDTKEIVEEIIEEVETTAIEQITLPEPVVPTEPTVVVSEVVVE